MRRRPLIVAGSAALAALAGVAGVARPSRSATGAPGKRGSADTRTLRIVFSSPETTLDPPQTQPGILFSDHPAFGGSPRELVAADYVYALKRFYDPRWKSADLYIFESLKLPGLSELRQRAVQAKQPFDYDTEVEGVRAVDRHTLRITLGVADPRFVYQLASAGLLGAVAREVVDFHGDDIGAHPVGTGAFRLKSWRRASQIELVRSPTWRGDSYRGTPADDPVAQQVAAQLRDQPLPRVDHVVVEIVEESQPRWLSFLNGSYEWLLVPGPFRAQAAPGGELAPYLAKRGMRLQAELEAAIAMSFFYMEHPLVGGYTPAKVALRRAIGLAFDGSAYIRNVLGGYALPAQSTMAPFASGYDAAYKSEMSDHDPARAKALLDLYGYIDRNGDGWREPRRPTTRALRCRLSIACSSASASCPKAPNAQR